MPINVLVATDIFGETPELIHWLTPIVQASRGKLELVSPYLQLLDTAVLASAAYPADELAYRRFLAAGGIEAYTLKLQHSFNLQREPFIAIGFSAGAAALWQLAAKPQPGLQQLIGFYGGQIRHCVDVQPQIWTRLIWAQETHFDVLNLHRQLAQRKLVSSELTQYEHGFINPHSSGFNREAASDYQQWMIEHVNAGVRVVL